MKKGIILLVLILVLSALMLTGCLSTDKSQSYINTGDEFAYSCSYDSIRNITTIKIETAVKNDTIYSIDSVILGVDLYLNNVLIKKDFKVTYNNEVKHGAIKNIGFKFDIDGEINKVQYNSWKATYKSLWKSYYVWFVATLVVMSVILLIFIIITIASDLDFYDVGDFFEDHLWLLPTALIVFIPYIVDGFISSSWSWIPPLIISGGLLGLVLLCVIALGIKEAIVFGLFCRDEKYNSSEPTIKDEDGNSYTIDDSLNDKEMLKAFSKENLIEWCRINQITGYSKLNKDDLISLIMDYGDTKTEYTNTEKKPKTKPKTEIVKKTGITFDDIAGLEDAKKAFREKVIMPIQHKELYEKFGKKVGGGILLYGLPGTGKTMFAEAASNELDALFIPIKCSDIKSKWYGESEQKVKDIFNKARKAKNAIIFFDEFEAIGAKRTDTSDNGNNDLVPQILAEMQGIGTNNSNSMILVIAATNKPWSIDSAFLRPGRFDEKIYIPLPDYEARKKMFEIQLSKLPHEDDLDYDLLAKLTEGCNGADIKEVCEKLKMSAINDSIKTGIEQTIGMDDVEKIKDTIKSSVQKDEIYRIEEFSNS